MGRNSRTQFAMLALVCLLRAVSADDNAAATDHEAAKDAHAAVDRILAVIEIALTHHVDPPARQQMVLEVARALEEYSAYPEPTAPSIQARQELAQVVSNL